MIRSPSVFTKLVLRLGAHTLRKFQPPREHPPTPDWPGARALSATSRDGCKIHGWWQPSSRRPGTLVFVHGITIHSFHYLEQADYLARETGLAVAALDLRFHGLSGDAPLTFGAAESWDVRAFLDVLEAAGATRPYLLIGDSLGGLAVQRAIVDDPRVDGAVLMQTPGWAWNAIRSVGGKWSWLAYFLNRHFGHKVLEDSDLRNHLAADSHRPALLYIMGEADLYDWRATKEIYDWWGGENAGVINETPVSHPDRARWFILVEGAVHDTGAPDCYNVWRWSATWPNILRFIEIVVERF